MTYCMSDIHGEILKWRDMLELIQFSDEDTLYVLGDVIDLGTGVLNVLTAIIDTVGSLNVVLAGVGIYAFVKNFD